MAENGTVTAQFEFIFNDDGASDMRQELWWNFFSVSVFLLDCLCESPLHYIENRIECIANVSHVKSSILQSEWGVFFTENNSFKKNAN